MGSSQSTRKITLVNDESAGVIKLSESLAYRLRGQLLEGQSPEVAPTATGDDNNALPPTLSQSPFPTPPKSVSTDDTSSEIPEDPPIISSSSPIPLPPSSSPSEEGGSSHQPSVPVKAPLPAVDNAVLPPTPPPTPPPVTEQPIDVTTSTKLVPSIQINGNGTNSSWNLHAEEAHLAMLRLREEKDEHIKNQDEQWREKLACREKEYMDQAQLTQDSINSSIANVESLFLKTSYKPICQEKQEEVRECFAAHPKRPLLCAELVRQFRACVNLNQLQAVLNERTS